MRKTQGDERELLLSDEALICLGTASLCSECECWGVWGVGWGGVGAEIQTLHLLLSPYSRSSCEA